MTIKEFWNKPINQIIPTQKAMLRKNKVLNQDSPNNLFRIYEWINDNPGEFLGIVLMVVVGIVLLFISWLAVIVWIIIIGIATIINIGKTKWGD